MTKTLYAEQIRLCLDLLSDAQRWLERVRADAPPMQHMRLEWIDEDIKLVREVLQNAAVADVSVERAEAA